MIKYVTLCKWLLDILSQNILHHKSDHFIPILKTLHWLLIKFRIDFKILLFAYNFFYLYVISLQSIYLKYSIQKFEIQWPEPSLSPTVQTQTYGDRVFSVVGLWLWNNLPLEIRLALFLTTFKSLLKTYLLSMAYN